VLDCMRGISVPYEHEARHVYQRRPCAKIPGACEFMAPELNPRGPAAPTRKSDHPRETLTAGTMAKGDRPGKGNFACWDGNFYAAWRGVEVDGGDWTGAARRPCCAPAFSMYTGPGRWKRLLAGLSGLTVTFWPMSQPNLHQNYMGPTALEVRRIRRAPDTERLRRLFVSMGVGGRLAHPTFQKCHACIRAGRRQFHHQRGHRDSSPQKIRGPGGTGPATSHGPPRVQRPAGLRGAAAPCNWAPQTGPSPARPHGN